MVGNFPETFGWKLLLLVGNFQKLWGSIENFPETFGWKLFRNLKTFGNFINKLSRNLTSGWKLLLLVGNFQKLLGSIENFLETFIGNFSET